MQETDTETRMDFCLHFQHLFLLHVNTRMPFAWNECYLQTLLRAIVLNLGSRGVLGLKFAEAFTSSSAGQDFWVETGLFVFI